MTITRGEKHNFIGMNINFENNGSVQVEMIKYLKECIGIFVERDSIQELPHQEDQTFLN